MPTLTAVDFDPFADDAAPAAPKGLTLTPVDHDPFQGMTWGETAADTAKGVGSGLVKGTAMVAGLPGDVRQAAGAAGTYLRGKLGLAPMDTPAPEPEPDQSTGHPILDKVLPYLKQGAGMTLGPMFSPTTDQLLKPITDTAGPLYQAKSKPGQYAQSVAELVPGAVTGGEATLPAAVRAVARFAVLPGVAGQAAEDAAPEGTGKYARAAASILTPAVLPHAIAPFAADAAHAANVDALTNEGVHMTAGDRLNAPWLRRWENDLSPDGNPETARTFTRAAFRRVGMDVPQGATAGQGGTVDTMLTDIGNRFDNLQARNQINGFDQQLGRDLQTAQNHYNDLVGPSQRSPIVENAVHDLGNQFVQHGGTLPGDAYKSIRSRLNDAARGTKDPELSGALHSYTEALDGAMERSIATNNPADLGQWRQARRDYRNALVLERAAGSAGPGTANGTITPAQLASAAKAVYGKRTYLRGHDDFSDLANPGVAAIKPLPDSGTSQRVRINDVIKAIGALGAAGFGAHHGGAAGAAEGFVGGGLGAEWTAPLWEPAVRGVLRRGLMNRPMQRYIAGTLPGQAAVAGAPGLLSTAPGQMLTVRGLLDATGQGN